ncbi:hypothetical protein KHA93_03015 [Bacillus sp. FJAT-49732]|uniref:Uncharacterized protein n=1 Tax=Lederbergia citrisecunda TaxID=2833583 RepID=A0A942YJY6_9BACI|nr:hypothetical protein [Lederbergia citrisecunda]MBS4198619.1 hypothetical protein [Lederbergia citrisecunda]
MTLSEAVREMYNALMDIGFTQNQIDEMDIVYHLKLLAQRKKEKQKPKNDVLYIDQVLG